MTPAVSNKERCAEIDSAVNGPVTCVQNIPVCAKAVALKQPEVKEKAQPTATIATKLSCSCMGTALGRRDSLLDLLLKRISGDPERKTTIDALLGAEGWGICNCIVTGTGAALLRRLRNSSFIDDFLLVNVLCGE